MLFSSGKSCAEGTRHRSVELLWLNTVAEHYKHLLGQAPVERAVNSLGNDVLTARKNGNLYISGLGGGLNVSQQKGDKQVKEHTFFGK